MNVGLYFGTFDPLHNGHLALVGHMLAQPHFDALWLVPSPQSPHKRPEGITPFAARCRAIARVVEALGDGRLHLCTIEGELPLPSYTVQTLRHLHVLHPHCRFALIMGADNVEHLPQWREGDALLASYPIYVYPRRGFQVASAFLEAYPKVHLMEAPLVEISSTAIRQGQAAGHNMDYLLPLVSAGR